VSRCREKLIEDVVELALAATRQPNSQTGSQLRAALAQVCTMLESRGTQNERVREVIAEIRELIGPSSQCSATSGSQHGVQ
jgi:hypothetical protein